RLARSGMVFTNGYSASPVCSPTRAAIMTGKYPARLRLTAHLQGAHRLPYSRLIAPAARLQLPHDEITLAELLRQAGYRTAAIGKWHLGAGGFLPASQGFDVAHAGDEAGSTSSFFYPAWTKKVHLEGADGDYLTDRLTTLAVDFIRQNKERPFFLYLPHFAVHTPIEGKPAKVGQYEARVRPGDPQNYAEYAAMVESMDESVGRVLDTLDELKLSGNTIVVFTADNGGVSSLEWRKRPVTSNLPLRAGKGHLYEGGIRVPTIVRWPGVTRAGSRSDAPVHSIDYLPTLAEAAGIARSRLPAVDGVSLAPLLRGRRPLARELFWYYPHYSPQLGRPSAAIRRGDDKLILFFEDQHVELYNLRDDLGESQDLAARFPEKTAALRSRLQAWLDETRADLPVPNANYDPAREREPGPPMGPIPEK
ncbi:MAG: sulfatase, partial [Bryobacteraceae bacterium]